MGEKKRRIETFARAHPFCCYCGGKRLTESIDHAPPKVMFINRLRASGLGVPACSHCNQRFSAFDSFFALLVLSMGSAFHVPYDSRIVGLIGAAARRFPRAISEMVSTAKRTWVNTDGLLRPVMSMKFQNEEIPFTINFMASRIAAVVYYSHTAKTLPVGAVLYARWQTNVQPFGDEVMQNLLQLMPLYMTLKQGNWDQAAQFQCRYAVADDLANAAVAFNFHGIVQSVVFIDVAEQQFDVDDAWMEFGVTDSGLAPTDHPFPRDLRISDRK